MLVRSDFPDLVVQALKSKGNRARLIDVAKWIWANKEAELKASGDIFYTWQYDARWAADRLRKLKIMKSADISPKGIWELS